MRYTVKPAENHHVHVLPSIERAAAEMFSLEDLPLERRLDVTSIDVFQGATERGLLWVAVNERDAPVGFLLADIIDGNFHIKEIDVLPGFAGKGIGTKLLHCAFDAALKQRYACITLTTFEHIQQNAPFYRRQGFSVLTEVNCGKELSAIIAKEKACGLKNRIAMCRNMFLENT